MAKEKKRYDFKKEQIATLRDELQKKNQELKADTKGHRPKNRYQLEEEIQKLQSQILLLGGDIDFDEDENAGIETIALGKQVENFGRMVRARTLSQGSVTLTYADLLEKIEDNAMSAEAQQELIDRLNAIYVGNETDYIPESDFLEENEPFAGSAPQDELDIEETFYPVINNYTHQSLLVAPIEANIEQLLHQESEEEEYHDTHDHIFITEADAHAEDGNALMICLSLMICLVAGHMVLNGITDDSSTYFM